MVLAFLGWYVRGALDGRLELARDGEQGSELQVLDDRSNTLLDLKHV